MPDFKSKIKTPDCLNKTLNNTKHVKVESFNKESTLYKLLNNINDERTYLIIGTLTPCSGRNPDCGYTDGYFYCSEDNNMYEFIQNAKKWEDCKDLVKLKDKYRKSNFDPDIKKEIINTLLKRRIAFLDVIKEAVVVIDSASDNDIYPFILEKERFNELNYDHKNLKVVANSVNAQLAFKQMTGRQIDVIPQMLLGNFKKYPKGKTQLQQYWTDWLTK